MKAETLWSNQRSPADDWGKMAGKGSIGAQGWLFPEVEAPETEAECPNRGYVRPIKAQWG